MKKLLSVIMCVFLLAGLFSCEEGNENASDSGANLLEQPTGSGNEGDALSPNGGKINAEAALTIAKGYWESAEKNGYIVIEAQSKRAPETVYVFVLKHFVDTEVGGHYSTVDEIWIDRTTGETIVPYDAKPGLMFDYDEVLWCYKYAVDYNNYEALKTVDNIIADFNVKYGKAFLDEQEKQCFAELAVSGYILYPGNSGNSRNNNNPACGYAKKDLNGDEIEELVLLNADYSVVAIFSLKDGRPILLQNFWDKCSGLIDKNGYVHVGGNNGAGSGSCGIYRIAEGGVSLDLLFEYGTDGYEWVNDVAVIKCYKIENGEKKYITEEEYNSISEQYDRYLGNRLGKEVTKEDSGLKFTPLFSEAEIFGGVNDNDISPEEAIEIARERFGYPPNAEGATGTVIVNSIKVLNNPNHFYHVVLQAQWYERDTYYAGGEPYRTTYPEEIFISTSSGYAWWGIKDVGQEFDADNSPISIEEAERIASEYWGVCEGERPYPEATYEHRFNIQIVDDGIYHVTLMEIKENGAVDEIVDVRDDIYVAAYTGCVFSLNGK